MCIPGGSAVSPLATQETWIQSLGQEDPLEEDSFNTSKESTNLLTALFLGFSINLQHNLTPAYPMGPGDPSDIYRI